MKKKTKARVIRSAASDKPASKKHEGHATSAGGRGLDGFAQLKARAVEIAGELREIAAERDDRDALAVLERFRDRFKANQLLVVVAGEFKRGKSTLVNALAGRAICPVHVTPKTAKLTRLLAEDDGKEWIEVHFKDGRPPERRSWTHQAMNDLVSVRGSREAEISTVDVHVTESGGPLLRKGISLVDTPGLESLFKDHDRITREYLPRADILIFCLSANQPLGARERDFLLTHRHLLDKTVIALNHFDIVPRDERTDTLSYLKESLKAEVFGSSEDIPLHPVSARDYLDALADDDTKKLNSSGVPTLADAIIDRLGLHTALPVMSAVAKGLGDVADVLLKQVNAAREALDSATVPADVSERCARAKSVLQEKAKGLASTAVRTIETSCGSLATSAAADLNAWSAQFKRDIRSIVSQHKTEQACRTHLPTQLAQVLQRYFQSQDAVLRDQIAQLDRRVGDYCRGGFREMESEAVRALSPGRAHPALADIGWKIAAIADLGAVANCLGGPVGGFGLARTAIEPAFAMPPELKALTAVAGITSVLALFGGPIGWGVAALGWLAVAVANIFRSSTWQERVVQRLDKAVDDVIMPRAVKATSGMVWSMGRALQDHYREHIGAVDARLHDALVVLEGRVSQDRAGHEKAVRTLNVHSQRLEEIRSDLRAIEARLKPKSPRLLTAVGASSVG